MKFNTPMIVEYVIGKLKESGYEAYLVGGSVRDAIMGYDINDYDITTNASLDEIKLVFSCDKVKEYSNKITLCVIKDHEHAEVTPFKGETIVEDLSKRDFTINAIAYDLNELIDPFKGRFDLFNKIIRTPIDPKITITNDPLRILRAIRFSGKYDFEIDCELKDVMNDNADLLLAIKKDRLKVEFDKILLLDNPSRFIREFKQIFFNIIPALRVCDGFDQQTKYHNLDVFEHIIKVVDNVDANLISRLAALMHDIKKPECFSKDEKGGHFYGHYLNSKEYAHRILKDFNYSNDIIKRVSRLVEYHDYSIDINNKKAILNFLYKFKTQDLDLLFDLKRADKIAQHPDFNYQIEELSQLYEKIKEIINNNEYIDIHKLAIDGNDLVNLGVEQTRISEILDRICMKLIEGKLTNTKEDIYDYVNKIK